MLEEIPDEIHPHKEYHGIPVEDEATRCHEGRVRERVSFENRCRRRVLVTNAFSNRAKGVVGANAGYVRLAFDSLFRGTAGAAPS